MMVSVVKSGEYGRAHQHQKLKACYFYFGCSGVSDDHHVIILPFFGKVLMECFPPQNERTFL